MSYRNRHQIHRADQVWNRDIMHSDEEDLKPRSAYSAYSPGYSNRQPLQSNSAPEGNDYGDYRQNRQRYSGYDGNSNYGRSYDDRYRGRNYDDYNRYGNRHYDYDSGELTSSPNYDRHPYGRSQYEDRYDRYDRDDRGYRDSDRNWWDRSKDEVRSWFGDDAAERRRDRDRVMDHRGKGPKNYQRSDERIREDINDRLSDDDVVDASELEVEVNGSEVVLKGSVTTRPEKRRAEDIAESVSGVRNVENRLRVTNTGGGINMDRYTGTTGDFTGIGSSSGTTSEIIRDVRNSKEDRY